MSWLGYAAFAALVAIYALTATRLSQLKITGPIVFLVAGAVLHLVGVSSTLEVGVQSEFVRQVTAIALVLLLFSDASTIDLGALRRDAGVPVRLLLIGLPLAVALGALGARLVLPGMAIGLAALMGAILAPTDLSLGLAMFENPNVPQRIARLINVESGLNDGIVAPLVTLFAAFVTVEAEHAASPLVEAVREIALGAAVGAAVGVLGGWFTRALIKRGWSESHSHKFVALALALFAYVCALGIHGNGFIAAFVGGLAFGAVVGKPSVETAEYAEETGTLMTLGVWFIFGFAVAPILLDSGIHPLPILYALLSLTIIRMVPVAICLLGKGLRRETVVFTGWFGPRGLASVVFLLQVLPSLQQSGTPLAPLVEPVAWTILLSVILHGASAGPVANWYAKKTKTFPAGSFELGATEVVPTRHGLTLPSSHAAS